MDTETLDKLYLELSQITNARNQREKAMMRSLSHCIERLELIGECDCDFASPKTISQARTALGPPILK